LAKDTASALFTESYSIFHPSQPNYLVIYSGNNQGVTDDSIPVSNPFTTPNLGRQLLDAGKTFMTYSEDLPSVGYNGETYGYYARRHNPATNWLGNGTNQISPTTIQPFTAFPSSDFTLLPTVCFVQPSTLNDMHDGVDPDRITVGDNWIATNLDSYIQWAKVNNSLFFLTFDEDDSSSQNHITTIFTGKMIQGGQYSSKINHYSILNTIEQLVGMPLIGDSTIYGPITYCWKNGPASDSSISVTNGSIYPNPCNGSLYVDLSDYQGTNAEIYNLNGMLIQISTLVSKKTEIKTNGFTNGLYLLKIKNKEGTIRTKFIKN
jgi:acid phosphatase